MEFIKAREELSKARIEKLEKLESYTVENTDLTLNIGPSYYATKAKREMFRAGKIDAQSYLDYCKARGRKAIEKSYLEKLDKIVTLENINPIGYTVPSVTASIEWRKNRIWGNNPTCTVEVSWNQTTGSASGCGYDKASAAMAEALNQQLSILAMIAKAREDGLELPYGVSFYEGIPSFSGGVGVSCFRNAFEVLGYRWEETHGKTFDVYHITKK